MTRIEVPNTAGRRRSGRSGGAGRWFMILLLLLIVGGGLWTWLTLAWAYAEGERAGVLQKFVRRGCGGGSRTGCAVTVLLSVLESLNQGRTGSNVGAGLENQRVGHGVETLGNPKQQDDMRK